MISNWQQAFLATAAISLIPNVLLFAIPTSVLTAKDKTRGDGIVYQHIMLCFAAGGLLGDVVLHTLPHLMLPHDHGSHAGHGHSDTHAHAHAHEHAHVHGEEALYGHSHHDQHHHHDHDNHHGRGDGDIHGRMLFIGVTALAGFLFFFLVEKLAALHMAAAKQAPPVLAVAKEVKAAGSTAVAARKTPARAASTTRRRSGSRATSDDERDGPPTRARSNSRTTPHSHSHADSHGHAHVHVSGGAGGGLWASLSRLSAKGWLNLLADGLHNFTDGVALGASFGAGRGSSSLGLAALLSVMMHEVPHELGDVAILVEGGLTKWEAIRAQFATAGAAFVGTAVGLLAGRHEQAEQVLLAATAGGFLYIAATSIMPVVVKGSHNGAGGVAQVVLEGLAFAAGVGFMVAVALLE
jgi:zinc transporter 7